MIVSRRRDWLLNAMFRAQEGKTVHLAERQVSRSLVSPTEGPFTPSAERSFGEIGTGTERPSQARNRGVQTREKTNPKKKKTTHGVYEAWGKAL